MSGPRVSMPIAASGAGGGALKFPEALTRTPKCFVALSGLDTRNNAVHRAVFDEFRAGGRRAERKPVVYRDVPANHLYPKCSTCEIQRLTYEDYVPVGILKTCWFRKHTEELPALVVFFFDLDWTDPQWEERQTECASKIEVIRSALHGRSTEIVVVLLQSTPPMPVGDASSLMSERAAAICTACSLPRLNLFALPFTDRPQGFITKLEEAIYERALQYYNTQIKKVKAHKDLLNKQSHLLLHIRHQFKIAFFTEMRQDPHTALRLYRTAYNFVLEVMYLSEDRIMEFKLVAGFLNYKISRLCFELDEALQSIQQFRRHIERFSSETGPRQLAFEHLEWMSRQFSAFGELFSDAVKKGLKGIQTQNPGIYFQQAAMYALERKRLSSRLCLESSRVDPNLLHPLPEATYFGQRPWRIGQADDQATDPDLKQQCVLSMHVVEFSCQHSWQIIPLLSKAISHLKNFHCERMITYLKVLMGQEYYQVNDYEKSLVLLRGVVASYRQEQWWEVLASILQTVLRCSYILCNFQDYFTAALELISNYCPVPVQEKKRIQNNMTAVLSGHTPNLEAGLRPEALDAARELWAGLHDTDQSLEFTVQASSLASCVECKTAFSQAAFKADSPVELKVHLRSTAPLPLTLSKVMVQFYQDEYNSWCVVDEAVVLEPLAVKTLPFTFPASQTSLGDSIEVLAVQAMFGREGVCSVTLLWSNGVAEGLSSQPRDTAWEKVLVCTSTLIQPRPPGVDIVVRHSSPALMGEYYGIDVGVVNREEGVGPLLDLRVGVALADMSDDSAQPTAELHDTIPSTHHPHQHKQSLELVGGPLNTGEKFEKTVHLCSHTLGKRRLNITVSYSVYCTVHERWDPVVCTCQKEEVVTVETVKPFEFTYRLMNMNFKIIDSVNFEEPFVLLTEIHCMSPWQLLIVGSHFSHRQLPAQERREEVGVPKAVRDVGETNSQIEGLELCIQDKASEVRCLVASQMQAQQSSIGLGTYTVQWRRASDPHTSCTLSSTVALPAVPAKELPYSVSAKVPAYGQLHETLSVCYTVQNRTVLVQEFEVRLGASDAFMFSGKRLTRFRILPSSAHTLTYNLLPVTAGLVPLPHFDLVDQRDQKPLDTTNHTLPSTIFVKPSTVSPDSDSEST